MTIEAAQESTEFTANFDIVITGIRTIAIGSLTNVIKQVEWTLKGKQGNQTFELIQKTELDSPAADAENFVPLESITDPAVIIEWVLATDPRINALKSHIQMVLDKQTATSTLKVTPLPWEPIIPNSKSTPTYTDMPK